MFLDENFILLKGKAGPHIWKKWSTKEFDQIRLRKEAMPMIRGGGFDTRMAGSANVLKNKTRPELIMRLGVC